MSKNHAIFVKLARNDELKKYALSFMMMVDKNLRFILKMPIFALLKKSIAQHLIFKNKTSLNTKFHTAQYSKFTHKSHYKSV